MRLAFQSDYAGNIYRDFAPRTYYDGLGFLGDAGTIAATAAQGAATTGSILTNLANLGVISAAFGPAAPIAAVVAGLTSVGLALANIFSGCGQTCVEASNLANQAEPILAQNLRTYLNSPIRYASMQAAALNNYNFTWQALVRACSNPALGNAGVACIADRQAGSCKWQTSPGGWQSDGAGGMTYVGPGGQGSGSACWNWDIGYRLPIASDPTVVPDPTPATVGIAPGSGPTGVMTTQGSGFSLPMPLLLGGGLLLLLAMVNQ